MGWMSGVRCQGSESLAKVIPCELNFEGVGWEGQPDMCKYSRGRKWYVPAM